MKLLVKRIFRGDTYTIGRLYLDYENGNGWTYYCDTLEDKVRITDCDCSQKVYGQTAIPEGLYEFTMVYLPKYKRYVPFLQDVPCFTGILIHAGANDKDTLGCILVGYNTIKGGLTDGIQTAIRLSDILMSTGRRDFVITVE